MGLEAVVRYDSDELNEADVSFDGAFEGAEADDDSDVIDAEDEFQQAKRVNGGASGRWMRRRCI